MYEILQSRWMRWPTSWGTVFGRKAPLLLEIGFGNGDFLIYLGRSRKECNVLGVEISARSLAKGRSKIEHAKLANVRVVRGSAPMVLRALCEPESISEMYINFPDPWPKAHHVGRRLIDERFLQLAASRLETGALLRIATDVASYASAIAELLEREPYFENCRPTPFVNQEDRSPTKYERIARAEGRSCHYFMWRRNERPNAVPFPFPEEFPMPHVVINSPLPLASIGRSFAPASTSSGSIHVNLLESYLSPGDAKLLVEVYIGEESLRQRIAVTVKRRRDGDLVVGLGEIGFPRVTAGAQLAVARVALWIIGLHPDSALRGHNLRPAVWEDVAIAGGPPESQ